MNVIKKKINRLFLHSFLIFIGVVWLLPTFGVLITSFRTAADVARTGWWTIFTDPLSIKLTLAGYIKVLTHGNMGRAFINSLIVTIPSTILPILLASLAAMAFAWMKFPLRTALLAGTISLVSVPLQATVIPILTLYNKIGLTGKFYGIWMAHTGYGLPLIIYFLYNFFKEIPHELLDSASIDGASTLQIFSHIILPLSIPALASITIFQFLWVWNDLFIALLFLGGNPNAAPLTVTLSTLVGSRGQGWELLTSAAFISSSIPIIVFFSLQRYFVRGIMAGSIKA